MFFAYVKSELPKLREDLKKALTESKKQLNILSNPRAIFDKCKKYLIQFNFDFYKLYKAAIKGYYEGNYFNSIINLTFFFTSIIIIRRLYIII